MCLVFLPPHASGDHTTIYAINHTFAPYMQSTSTSVACLWGAWMAGAGRHGLVRTNHTPSETPPPGPYPPPSTTTRLRHSTQNTQRNRQNKITTQGSYLNIKNLLPYRSVKETKFGSTGYNEQNYFLSIPRRKSHPKGPLLAHPL
jgi:hypothetical protein